VIKSSTEQGQARNFLEDKQSRGEISISSSKEVSLVETWGQAVVQDGGSVDHGSSAFPIIYFMYK